MAGLNWSQAVKSGGLSVNDPKKQQQQGLTYPAPQSQNYNFPQTPQYNIDLNKGVKSGGLVINSPARNISPAPSTGGQGTGSGSGGGGQINLQAPSSDPGFDQDALMRQLRDEYGAARSDIEGQNPILEDQYNIAKGDIEGGIADTQKAGEAQKQNVATQFGDILKNQLRTYQDLGRQRQGTFSALGTLDSSSFGEQQFRADQSLAEQRGRTDLEQTRSLQSIDDQLTSYVRQGQSELSKLANQFLQGKQAIASALAQNRVDEAGAIRSTLDQIRQRANQVQDTIANFQNQASLLKAQGLNVRTNVGAVNANAYGSEVANQLQGLTNQGQQTYSIPTQASPQGIGYVPNKKKTYTDLLGYA